jgi:gluconolactonase
MKLTASISLLLSIAVCGLTACQSGETNNDAKNDTTVTKTGAVPDKRIEILDAEANAIIDSTAAIEELGSGYKWAEGPVYIKDGDYVLFSDIPNNRINKWKEGSGVTTYLEPSGHTYAEVKAVEPGSNGLVLNAKGELVMCQHGDRRLAKMDAPLSAPAPKFVTVVDKYMGKRLNSPNDAVYAANGDLYFTDPPYGLDKRLADTAKQLDFQGVYRLKPNGKLDLLTKDIKFPNGIAFSPDGKTLYVSNSDSTNMQWLKYALDAQGLIKSSAVFYEPKEYNNTDAGNPDGMKVNKQGYIFAAGPKGIWIFNTAGKPIARIYTGQKTANCAFSPDEKTLFITASSYLMRVKLK